MSLIIIKLLCLLLAIMYGFNNIGRLIRKQPITTGQIFLMSIGIVGFVAIQFNLF